MAKIKGVSILNGPRFALAREGPDGWQRVLAALAPEDREAMSGVVPVGWYDVRFYDRVNRAMVDALGGGSMDVMVALGRFAAQEDLSTIHRLFLRVANPAYTLERVAEFWARYQDSGHWTIVREAPNRVRATLVGWGSEDEVSCVRLGAYTQRLFELVGAKGVHLTRAHCRARGDEACVFVGSWR